MPCRTQSERINRAAGDTRRVNRGINDLGVSVNDVVTMLAVEE